MKKWPIYSDFSILSHNSGNFGQNEKQVLFSEGATSGTEPSSFPESSMVMCKNVVYQWSAPEHCPTIPLQAHCEEVSAIISYTQEVPAIINAVCTESDWRQAEICDVCAKQLKRVSDCIHTSGTQPTKHLELIRAHFTVSIQSVQSVSMSEGVNMSSRRCPWSVLPCY